MYYGERFNAWTHLIGALLALAMASGDGWKIFSVAVYGATLVLLYSISTIYHSVRGRAKAILRKLDHLSIYLLIAGSYTPFCLVSLRGPWGWTLFGVVWGLAVIGILVDLRWKQDRRIVPVVIYLVMGWLVVFAIEPLRVALDPMGFGLLVAGGVAYTLGVPFFALGRYWPMLHGIWHVLVLAGSVLHYLAILWFVAPG